MRERIEIPKSPLTDRQLKYGEDPKVMFLIILFVVACSTSLKDSVMTFGIELVLSHLPHSVIVQLDNFFNFFDTTRD